jgi:hypothetical protein
MYRNYLRLSLAYDILQFEKFQGFAAQLTKEASDLKVKIEQHKKENARLAKLIEQQKIDSNTLALRLAGTEKQRDDALEALVIQQEVAEELERERKKNKKELKDLVDTNRNIQRQRDEAQRVVIHLRALIEGQAHHMQHLVLSINDPEPEDTFEEGNEDTNSQATARQTPLLSRRASRASSRSSSRTASRASTIDPKGLDAEDVTPEMERRLYNSPAAMKRFSQMSWSDVADRNIRDKTDAIADIIRNISEQCAAAVEGLHLAQAAAAQEEENRNNSDDDDNYDDDDDVTATPKHRRHRSSIDGDLLRPNHSSVPPTPDLTHRASTAMSMNSTHTPDRYSIGYGDIDVPTRILEDEDGMSECQSPTEASYLQVSAKDNKMRSLDGLINRAGARVSAFGSP